MLVYLFVCWFVRVCLFSTIKLIFDSTSGNVSAKYEIWSIFQSNRMKFTCLFVCFSWTIVIYLIRGTQNQPLYFSLLSVCAEKSNFRIEACSIVHNYFFFRVFYMRTTWNSNLNESKNISIKRIKEERKIDKKLYAKKRRRKIIIIKMFIFLL